MKTAIFVSLVVVCAVASLFEAYEKSGKHISLVPKRLKELNIRNAFVK